MASVPAQSANERMSGSDIETDDRRGSFFTFSRLTLIRQIGLMVGLAASVALGVAVVLWAQEPNYQPVLGDMSTYNPQDVTTILDQSGIPYHMDTRSGALLVPAEHVYDARLKLAAQGVTDQKAVGYELLDRERGLGTSQFMESITYRRGLEGELARTISSMRSVKGARVHLAIPERSVFIRDARQPTASVFLEVFAGRRLEKEQIEAIVNLVAGSIPEMTRNHVTVVDQAGNLLTADDREPEVADMKDRQEYHQRLEDRLASRVANMLRPVVGDGRFKAQVSADLDFSSVEQAEELFNPNQSAVRSERELTEQRQAGFNGGIPGALSNQPPGEATVPEQANNADGEAPAAPPVNTRQEATRNYEVDRTVSYIRQERGRIERLTVAVAVDDQRVIDPETGEVSFQPWSEAELQRLTMLVRDAVGYSAARGDSVTVMNTAFTPAEEIEFQEPAFWEQVWFWDLIKHVLAGIVILVLLLVLMRPVIRALSGETGSELDKESDDYDGLESGGQRALEHSMSSSSTDLLLPGSSDVYGRQVNALKSLISEEPGRVAQVLRQWVNTDD